MLHPSFHARQQPDKPAYIMAGSGAVLSYGALDQRSNQGAQLFRQLGLAPQDHIALLMENCLGFMEICWAAQRSGLFFTAISTHLTPDEIAYIVQDCGARIFITSAALGDTATALLPLLPANVARYMLGDPLEGYDDWAAAIAAQSALPVADEVSGRDMLYSSGTTGRPKGVKPAFGNEPLGWISPTLQLLCQKMCGMQADSRYLSPAPLYHAAPLRFSMTAVALGGTVIVMEKFDAEHFLALVQRYRVTQTQLVPTMFVRMLKLPEATRQAYDISSLRAAVHAAAPCPIDVKRQMIEWWGPILIEYYAGTEGNGVTIINAEEWLAHPGSVGRSLVGEIKITDEAGQVLPPGQVGSIYFAGGPSFSYHNDAGKTAGAHSPEGWSTLGDIGHLDAEGYLYLSDRKAYMIISGGVNIYPQETENVLINHPAVLDCAVFGVPDDEMGEQVKAVVQMQPPAEAGPELAAELIAYCRSRLSPLKCPRSVDFVADLPRTPTGKLMKRLLRDRYWPQKTG